jgi:hypothetical protein
VADEVEGGPNRGKVSGGIRTPFKQDIKQNKFSALKEYKM